MQFIPSVLTKLDKPLAPTVIARHEVLVADFNCQGIRVFSTELASPTDLVITKAALELETITRVEIHWLTGFSLPLINRLLEDLREEGYLEYKLPYDPLLLKQNIKRLNAELVIKNPTREARELLQRSTLKQYQLTDLGRELVATGKRNSERERDLEFSLLSYDGQFIGQERPIKKLSGWKETLNLSHFSSLEKLVLDLQERITPAEIEVQGFHSDTEIEIREYKDCTMNIALNGAGQVLGAVLAQDEKLLMVDQGLWDVLAQKIPTDALDLFEHCRSFLEDLQLDDPALEPVTSPINAPDNFVESWQTASFRCWLDHETVIMWGTESPEIFRNGYKEVTFNLPDTDWTLLYSVMFVPDPHDEDSVCAFICESILAITQSSVLYSLAELEREFQHHLHHLSVMAEQSLEVSFEAFHGYLHDTQDLSEEARIYILEDAIQEDLQNVLSAWGLSLSTLHTTSLAPQQVLVSLSWRAITRLWNRIEADEWLSGVERTLNLPIRKKPSYHIQFLPREDKKSAFYFLATRLALKLTDSLVSRQEIRELVTQEIDFLQKQVPSEFDFPSSLTEDGEPINSLIKHIRTDINAPFQIKEEIIEDVITSWQLPNTNTPVLVDYHLSEQKDGFHVTGIISKELIFEVYSRSISGKFDKQWKKLKDGLAQKTLKQTITVEDQQLGYSISLYPYLETQTELEHFLALKISAKFSNKIVKRTEIKDAITNEIREINTSLAAFPREVPLVDQITRSTIGLTIPVLKAARRLSPIYLEKEQIHKDLVGIFKPMGAYQKQFVGEKHRYIQVAVLLGTKALAQCQNNPMIRPFFFAQKELHETPVSHEKGSPILKYMLYIFPTNDLASWKEYLLSRLAERLIDKIVTEIEIKTVYDTLVKKTREKMAQFKLETDVKVELLSLEKIGKMLRERLGERFLLQSTLIYNDLNDFIPWKIDPRTFRIHAPRKKELTVYLSINADQLEVLTKNPEIIQYLKENKMLRVIKIQPDPKSKKTQQLKYWFHIAPTSLESSLLIRFIVMWLTPKFHSKTVTYEELADEVDKQLQQVMENRKLLDDTKDFSLDVTAAEVIETLKIELGADLTIVEESTE